MLNAREGQPLHEAVREELQRRIEAKRYQAGDGLPSAVALASEFGVSLITVKRSLKDLRTLGLLRTVPGLGVFVRQNKRFIREIDVSMTSLEQAMDSKLPLSITLVSLSWEAIGDRSFDLFSPPRGPMSCVRRVISIDNEPIMFDTTYVPVPLDHEIMQEVSRKFVIDILKPTQTPVINKRLVIDAAPASTEAQSAFSIPVGYPTLRRLYHLTTRDPEFAVFGSVEAPFDKLACNIEIPIDDPTS
ncbi:GntR family transcriptional regulator [Bosea robiniae]|jgi:DNA-binding GntR family transcriptional regulator|uniref:DNA-binding transcriptional regulator, GntR family n=1 Tax=Bosea robiniae TaxID=1036780 RepID=A0ABY0NNF9_9HYPH|nr:GntR family transcriptional regulator [Bosea robiniae]SDF81903.1 DNA-binding transcriptional regulator, GntR family [Bosea robiniae]